jgi:hypothetical protein
MLHPAERARGRRPNPCFGTEKRASLELSSNVRRAKLPFYNAFLQNVRNPT